MAFLREVSNFSLASTATHSSPQEAIAALPQGRVGEDTVGSFLHDLCMVCHEAFGEGDEYMGMTCSHTFHKVCASCE